MNFDIFNFYILNFDILNFEILFKFDKTVNFDIFDINLLNWYIDLLHKIALTEPE